MDLFANLVPALGTILTDPMGLFWIFVGVVLGYLFGALPGLTATLGVALLIPLTFPLPTEQAIGMMIALYCGSMTGCAIPAILINIPGTPSAVVTTLDGYQMAKRGKAARAYGWALIASIVGGLLAWLALVTIAPALARLALLLGPAEYAAIALLGMTIISSISAGRVLKGLLCATLGVGLSVVGFDQITGEGRWIFDRMELTKGIDIMPALIGFLVIPEIISSLYQGGKREQIPVTLRNMIPTLAEQGKQAVNMIRSSLIGIGVGIVPALGGSIGSFLAYDQAKRFDPDKEEYGKGAPGGIVASEAANNGVTGGALIPLLTLGIPGDTVTAMLIGGLMIHGLQPGPRLFEASGETVWLIMAATLVANLIMIPVGIWGFRFFVKALDTPRHLLAPILLILTVIGTYSLANQWFDVVVMLILGVFGFLLTLGNFPVYPIVIGLILGPLMEAELRRALTISGGDWSTFVNRPGSATILAITVVALVAPTIIARMRRRRQAMALPNHQTTTT